MTPLHCSCVAKCEKSSNVLVRFGADIAAADKVSDFTVHRPPCGWERKRERGVTHSILSRIHIFVRTRKLLSTMHAGH